MNDEDHETPRLSRRALLKRTALMAAATTLESEGTSAAAPATLPATQLRWLVDKAPAVLSGVTWGVPWPSGANKPGRKFALRDAGGAVVPVQTWPLAYWPDGSLKWTAHAVAGPDAAGRTGLRLVPDEAPAAPKTPLTAWETGDAIEIDTGAVRCRVPKRGDVLFESLERDGRAVATRGRLVCLRQDAPELGPDGGTLKVEAFTGRVERATLEQAGPVRAVVKLEGRHRSEAAGREWLPFVVRLYFYAGSEAVRLVHSFVFDGDESRDFLRGLGVRFSVPMRDAAPHDRHVRFSGEGDGLWAEAVRTLTGLRRDPGAEARAAQVAGEAAPPVGEMAESVRGRLQYVPSWGDFTLSQLSADGFEIRKRTKLGHAWVRAAAGRRASGLGYVGGATGGGVAFGLRDFWQRHPTQLDVRGAAGDEAEVTLWLWSPDAPAMDLRFYHDGMGMTTHPEELEGLEITYEDYEAGWGTPHGVARTNELYLWALPGTPPRETLATMAGVLREPPLLVCAPERLHAAGVFGDWSPADRSTPARRRIEDQLDYLLALFGGQVEQRRWYGFWDHGDVMHSYDGDRHEWRYDVGGFAWANGELSPDLWLWYSFLRSGRAEVFRLAEAMTRHTSEVDVHHVGRFKGFGSRHNVQHWGDSSKQPRVSNAAFKRVFFFLTADERIGDLLRDLLDSDQTLREVKIGRKVGGRSTASPEVPDPMPRHPAPASAGFGTDWCSFAAAWLTEWERTGDKKWRDRLANGMRDIGRMPRGWLSGGSGYDPDTGRFSPAPDDRISVSHLSAVFGAAEISSELISLLDVPEYERAWLQYCEFYNAPPEEKVRLVPGATPPRRGYNLGESHSRLTAYAARRKKDPTLAERAWREFLGGAAGLGVRTDLTTRRITGPAVLNPVDEGFGMSCNAASQWGLAAIQNLALIGEWLPADLPAGKAPAAGGGDAG